MGKKNKNKRRGPAPIPAAATKKQAQKQPAKHGQATRETVESLVIAFVLAFLFRTFQAEAFVIPTGSMAPTLMGRHADLDCPECGERIRLNESELTDASVQRLRDAYPGMSDAQIMARRRGVAGECPNCRYLTRLTPLNGDAESRGVETQRAYSGDRILVNKYLYSFTDPKRWDVVVFKYPGNAVENYIKRLVGLPGEELKISGGDLFVRATGEAGEYGIVQKPADKILAVRQLVFDSDREPARLRAAGYPLRWSPTSGDANWDINDQIEADRVDLSYHLSPSAEPSWLRYRHIPASEEAWVVSRRDKVDLSGDATPQLITDFNAYNTTIDRDSLRALGLSPLARARGMHWVGDLLMDADVRVGSDSGELVLELIEAGCRFRCRFDVEAGTATLTAAPFGSQAETQLAACEQTGVRGAGRHTVRMANVDSRLTVWVDGSVLDFGDGAQYDEQALLAQDGHILPRQSDDNPGDLSPAAIGGTGLELTVDQLTLYRDIYYIADKSTAAKPSPNERIAPSDFLLGVRPRGEVGYDTQSGWVSWTRLMTQPESWERFRDRRTQTFTLGEDQFFVMGDNSAASSDARLWGNGNGSTDRVPGGPYLERKMLIGKAVCVYWPHSFDRVPGTGIPLPLFPNLTDMRLVR